jgi:hypothetical protein
MGITVVRQLTEKMSGWSDIDNNTKVDKVRKFIIAEGGLRPLPRRGTIDEIDLACDSGQT